MPDKFNYVKRGYDPSEVDSYVNSLENVLKSYKEKDSAIKNALINAQIAADNIVKNAEIEVENSKRKAVSQLEIIYHSIAKQKSLLDNLKSDYHKLASAYIKEVDEHDFQPVYTQIAELETFLNSLKNTQNQEEDYPSNTQPPQDDPSMSFRPSYSDFQ